MARVTEAEVRQLLAPYADTVDMMIFIDQATMLVDEELVAANSGYSDNRLKFIELNLAAHYAVLSVERGGFTTQIIGESEESYRGSANAKISSTRFGQQAISMDTKGLLATLDSPMGSAEFRVISSPNPCN